MDDLRKDVLEVWKLRLKIERVKKRVRALEWVIESDEYKQEYGEAAYRKKRAGIDELKREVSKAEAEQYKLEERIKLPNPYLKEPD